MPRFCVRALAPATRADLHASMATAILDDPYGYGRVIRDADGNFLDIIEQLDCTAEQREIKEVFPSYYCVKAEELLHALSKLRNDNKKGEYYLTDVVALAVADGTPVETTQAASVMETLGVNSKRDLE